MKKSRLLFYSLIISLRLIGCNQNNNSALNSVPHFRNYLDKLHKNELVSISKASIELKSNFSAAAPELKDSAFIIFRSFYYDVINSYYEVFWNNQDLVNKLNDHKDADPQVLNLRKSLDQNGLRLSKTEGGYYIDEKPDFLFNNFNNFTSNAINKYLSIRSKELKEGFSEDAKLIISFTSLGERILTWEKYLNDFPSSPLSAEAKFSYHLNLNTFLTGLDNSPVSSDDVLLPDMKNIYSDYFHKNSNSESGRIVEKFYAILSKNNFRLTSDLDDFYNENQIESMKGIEPPTR
jgi:hypothetical protein